MTAFVRFIHPDLPPASPGTTTQEAFDKVWKNRGYKIVTAAEAVKIETALTAPPVDLAKPAKTGGAA